MESLLTKYTKNCIICGSPNVEEHHLLYGISKRRIADKDRIVLPLCQMHHDMSLAASVHLNPAVAVWSKICGQLAWEMEAVADGATKEEARERFRKRYGRSYL